MKDSISCPESPFGPTMSGWTPSQSGLTAYAAADGFAITGLRSALLNLSGAKTWLEIFETDQKYSRIQTDSAHPQGQNERAALGDPKATSQGKHLWDQSNEEIALCFGATYRNQCNPAFC